MRFLSFRVAPQNGRGPDAESGPAPTPPAPDLHWPSGRGAEIGVVLGDIDTLWTDAIRSSGSVRRHMTVYDVEEDGMRSLVVEGLADGPLCLTAEPEIAADRVAIIADAGADPEPILASLRRLFGAPRVLAAD